MGGERGLEMTTARFGTILVLMHRALQNKIIEKEVEKKSEETEKKQMMPIIYHMSSFHKGP